MTEFEIKVVSAEAVHECKVTAEDSTRAIFDCLLVIVPPDDVTVFCRRIEE